VNKLGLKAICTKLGLSATTVMRYTANGMPFEYDFKGTRKVLKFDESKVNEWIELQRGGK